MYTGIILEIKNKYSIIMTSTSTVIRIKNKDGMEVGQQIFFHNEDIYDKPLNKATLFKNFSPLLAVAAIFIFLIITPLFKNTMTPYALISFDLNPSIEIKLDKNQTILNATGINKDGSNLNLDQLIGLSLNDGSSKLKEILNTDGYLSKEDNLLLGFTFLKKENSIYEEEVKNIFSSIFNESQILYLKSDKENLEKAHSNGISLGRYEAKLNIDEDLFESSIETMTIDEIMKVIKENVGIILNEDIVDELEDELEDLLDDSHSDDNIIDDDSDDNFNFDDDSNDNSDDDSDNDDDTDNED